MVIPQVVLWPMRVRRQPVARRAEPAEEVTMNRKYVVFVSVCLAVSMLLPGCVAVPAPAVQQAASTAAPAASSACTPAVQPPALLFPGKIIMATNATIPPVQFIDNEGNLKGMRVELGEEIARRLCLTPEWVNIQFDAMIPGLQGKRWDMINTGLFYTAERAKLMKLVPYELQAISISVPTGKAAEIKTTEDLAGKIVGVEIAGYEETQIKAINTKQVESGLVAMDIRGFNTFADAYQALRAGQVDAVTSVDATAKFYQDRGDFERAISGIAGSPASLAMMNEDLANAVAKVLNDMKKDGYYDKLFDQYGVAKIDKWDQWDGEFKIR
jgi:polar amino acid transport system substrate-binding protein